MARNESFIKETENRQAKEKSTAKAAVAQSTEQKKTSNGLFPSLSSGGRTYITVAGIPVAVCLDFSYAVVMDQEEVRTIDNQLPVDINIGQIKINGKLSRFVDPDGSLEQKGLFHTMQASLHQPIVEILVQDANGNSMFFCKGMFVSMDARYSLGQLSVNSVNFVGIQYQHWAYQEFVPYNSKSLISKANAQLNNLKNRLKGFGL
jgi:hypothetical protein